MGVERLLIVDDEPEFGAFAKNVAKPLGFDVTVIDQSRKFQEVYGQVQPDVIVLDIVMPDIDGIELIEWLIEIDNTARVVIVTGYNPHFAEAAKVFAKIKGRFSVTTLTKPMSIEALRAALRAS